MFKRSKFQPLPAPPTEQQILEDLETFEIAKINEDHEEIQEKLTELNIEEWWKIFEKYLDDYNQLKEIKKNIIKLKEKLLASQTDLIEERVELEKAIDCDLEKIKHVFN